MKHRLNHGDRTRPIGEITRLLANKGNPESLTALMRLVYNDLRRLASGHFRRERRNYTLQPTALVHEALIRLMEKGATFKNSAYFFGAASRAMRRILIESARRNQARKRGGGWLRVDFDEADLIDGEQANDLLDFDSALTRLETIDSCLCQVVELRAFGGFTAQETAAILGMGESTVRGKWSLATQWLRRALNTDPEQSAPSRTKANAATVSP